MSGKGGARPGAGRKAGGKNRATVAKENFAAEGIKAALDSGVTPLEVLLRAMRGDESISDRQFVAAKEAAPYIHPRLSSVEAKVEADVRQRVISAEPLSLDEWERRYCDPAGGGLGATTGASESTH